MSKKVCVCGGTYFNDIFDREENHLKSKRHMDYLKGKPIQVDETCQCGIVISNYNMKAKKEHEKSQQHIKIMKNAKKKQKQLKRIGNTKNPA